MDYLGILPAGKQDEAGMADGGTAGSVPAVIIII
jgi:hypothetical protein